MQASAFRQQVVRGSNQPTSRAFGQQERPVPNLEQPLFQMILMERIPTNSTQGGRITARISAENILPLGVMCSIYKAPLYADEQTVALSSNCFAERFNLKITLIYLFFFVGFSSMSFYFDWHELGTQERRMIREPSRSKNCLLAGVLRRRYPLSNLAVLASSPQIVKVPNSCIRFFIAMASKDVVLVSGSEGYLGRRLVAHYRSLNFVVRLPILFFPFLRRIYSSSNFCGAFG